MGRQLVTSMIYAAIVGGVVGIAWGLALGVSVITALVIGIVVGAVVGALLGLMGGAASSKNGMNNQEAMFVSGSLLGVIAVVSVGAAVGVWIVRLIF